MPTAPKRVSEFAREYEDMYLQFVQYKAAYEILRNLNDNKMDLQELLIDGIEWLKDQIEKCEPGQMRMDMQAKLDQWQEQLNTMNSTSGTTPKCASGYYWNGSECVLDVG